MALQGISTGTTPNDGTGDSLLVGAVKVNDNFQEIYNALGDGTSLLTGDPDLTVGFITATGASFTGDVSIGGTLTYEDVTNIDSVGLITARSGIHIGDPDGAGIAVSFSSRGHGYVGLLTVYDEFQVGPNLVGNGVTITSTGVNVTGIVTATTFEKIGGTSSQFLKADGSVDSSTYLTTALGNLVEDTTPQLGGDLDLNNRDITGTGDISIDTGNISLTNGYLQSNLGISTNSGSTTAQINVDSTGNQLIITVPGVGSTTLPLT